MNNVSLVQLSNTHDELCRVEFDDDLGELSELAQILVQVASRDMWHDKIKALIGLKEVFHAAQVRMLSLQHDIHLVESALNLIRVNQLVLSDALDCIEATCRW